MSLWQTTSMGVMRPPKPPCWRDFVVSTPKSINSDGVDVSETSGRSHSVRSPVQDLIDNSRVAVSLPGNKPSRLARRPRARIHRTRSEHVIQAEDLPESAPTTLADTDPRGLRSPVPEGRLYVEENNRRCQNWLAGIEAAEPLDKVDYTADHRQASAKSNVTSIHRNKAKDDEDADPLGQSDAYDAQQGVEVEIPEEPFVWSITKDLETYSPNLGRKLPSSHKNTTLNDDCDKTSDKASQSSRCSHLVSPKSSHRQQARNSPKTKRDSASYNCTARVSTCFKKTCGKKIYKLCCEDSCSSSQIENEGSDCLATVDECCSNLKHVQEGSSVLVSSFLSVNGNNIRSAATRASARKMLTD